MTQVERNQNLQQLKQQTKSLYENLTSRISEQGRDFKPENETEDLKELEIQVLQALIEYVQNYITSLPKLKMLASDIETPIRLLHNESSMSEQKTDAAELLEVQTWLKEVAAELERKQREEGGNPPIVIPPYPPNKK